MQRFVQKTRLVVDVTRSIAFAIVYVYICISLRAEVAFLTRGLKAAHWITIAIIERNH